MEQGHCPVCGYEGSTVSPADAAVALRSFPRRFRETLEAITEAGNGPAGESQRVLSGAEWVARALEIIDADLGRVLVSDQPPVHQPPLSAPDAPPEVGDAEAVLAHLTAAATALAARVSGVTADDWKRTGRQPDGKDLSALDLLRHAVHIGVHQLRESRGAREDDPEE